MPFFTFLAKLFQTTKVPSKATSIMATNAANKKTPEGNRLPAIIHQMITSETTLHRRVIIVGDVHGCASEFERLVDHCNFRPGVDLLISVGDLVNKGPRSKDALAFVQKGWCKAVRGNHDDAALQKYRKWLETGKKTKKEKYKWVPEIDEEAAHALYEMPFSMRLCGYNVLIVHAGLVPGVKLEDQSLEDLIKMRDCVVFADKGAAVQTENSDNDDDDNNTNDDTNDNNNTDTQVDWDQIINELNNLSLAPKKDEQQPTTTKLLASEKRTPAGKPWASLWRGPSHVFFGHDAGRRLQIHEWATGIDGGCVYGGTLYAVILPALDEFGAPMPEKTYVPDGAREIVLGTGLTAYLVGIDANEVYVEP